VFTRDMNLPRGSEREIVRYRDHEGTQAVSYRPDHADRCQSSVSREAWRARKDSFPFAASESEPRRDREPARASQLANVLPER